MAVPSYVEKFVSIDTLTSYVFGLKGAAVQRAQPVRVPMAVGVGADFAHDFSGFGVGVRDVETIGLSWLIVMSTAALVDAEVDLCRSKLLLIGKGKLYALFADGSERWCYARIASMPSPARAAGQLTHVPMAASFTRFSNWYSTTQTTGTQAISTTGTQSFTIANSGNVPVRNAVFRLRANAAKGFVTPSIYNSTTGETISTSRSADGPDGEVKIDCDAQSVYYSSNDGAAYADDYAKVTRGATQAGLMSLAAGNNTIVASGGSPWLLFLLMSPATQNYNFEWSFYPAYA